MKGLHVFLNGERGLAVVEAVVSAGHGIDAIYVPSEKLETLNTAQRPGGASCKITAVDNVNDPRFVSTLAEQRPSLLMVCGFSQIFRQPLIELPELGTINLHAGRLPKYRGGSPLNWQLINGESEAGISVVQLDAGIDSGLVLAEAQISIGPRTDIAMLHAEANRLFPEMVLSVLDDVARNGRLTGTPQDDTQAGYWHQRSDADGRIDWHRRKAEEVERFIRALTRPYPGAHTRWGEREVRVLSARQPEWKLHGAPGRVCYVQGEGPLVVCCDHALLLSEYVVDGGEIRLPHGAYLG